jgi:hypothetical protein
VKRALMNGITADQVGCFHYPCHEEWFVDSVGFMPNLDHQLLDHTRTSPNEEKRESFNPPPPCWPPAGSYMVLLSLIAFPRLLLTQKPLIPVTVQDQIRLWELEKNRVKSDEGTALISIDMMRTPLSCCPADSCPVQSLCSHVELTCLAPLSQAIYTHPSPRWPTTNMC